MAERSTISQVVQIGVEATPGTSVAASKRLQSLSIEPTPHVESQQFRPMGNKFNALSILGKEWMEANLTGRAVYDELIYPLASVLTTPTVVAAGTGHKWTFKPSTTSEDTPKTLTVEAGSPLRASKFTYGLVNEFGMNITRDGVELSGHMIGRAMSDGIVMTAAPTFLPLVPVMPDTIDVFADTTDAGLGTTKLGRLLTCQWQLQSRFGPLWVLDSAQDSWVAHVETVPALTATLLMEADAAGMAWLNTLRAGTTYFVRIQSQGPVIGAGPDTYEMVIDLPVKVVSTNGYSDADGVYAIEWSFTAVDDPTFDTDTGGALKVEITNATAAL